MNNNVKKINVQEPQRNRNATANFVNLIRTSTVYGLDDIMNNIQAIVVTLSTR